MASSPSLGMKIEMKVYRTCPCLAWSYENVDLWLAEETVAGEDSVWKTRGWKRIPGAEM